MAHEKKQVRFSPSVSMPPDDDAALTMLALHRNRNPATQSFPSNSSLKRKFAQGEWTSSKLRVVSPNDEEPQRGSVLARVSRNAAIPAPPFLDHCDDDCVTSPEARNAKMKCIAKETNPLDLLSTVSSQFVSNHAQKLTRTSPSTSSNSFHSSIGDKSIASNPSFSLKQGYKIYPNGSKYMGHFLDTQRHGFGICHYPNGHVYTGYWCNGQRSGLGLMRYANGDSYEGEWKNDVREGCGVFNYNDGMADVALWRKGRSVYGVQWSGDRKMARRLVDGMEGEYVGIKTALSIGRGVGVDSVPEMI
ncbi:hypothetical protein HJC23_007875 [Cyclotella cryptica]|uniref:MORN repeat-containing protein n=1 Tax=Cyclotella cryptica TaxID=29204 RepID=A0ABD3QZZ7_9STRA|eukprot:CCRYP_000199-RA/>CCRYP_000199-RA protein AED:0.01 eAED:0.01 QI:440/-1/1/1/-1/1/1/402/303